MGVIYLFDFATPAFVLVDFINIKGISKNCFMLILIFVLSRFLICMKAQCGVPASNAKWGEGAGIVTECRSKRYQEKNKSSIKVPNNCLTGDFLKRGIFSLVH